MRIGTTHTALKVVAAPGLVYVCGAILILAGRIGPKE